MIHELKTLKEYFVLVLCGSKQFELRINDKDFKTNDELLLKEWDGEKQEYTGRILHRRIDYILKGGQFGLENGYVIMSISNL